MTAILYLLHSIHALMILHAPAGAPLRVRLTTTVGSWSSTAGTPVQAVLIAPLLIDGRTTIPAGCMLSGKIKSVTRVGLGIRHERASLGLEFSQLTLPGGKTIPLSARLTQVDNGRERVEKNGLIEGVRATNSISYRVSGYIKTALLWHFHAELAEWFIKSLVVQLPESEIYYPAGTELTLRLTRQLDSVTAADTAPEGNQIAAGDTLSAADLEDLRGLVADMPVRADDPETGRPSDLTNVLLIGSKAQIASAFQAAGWVEARTDSIRSRIGCIRAAAEVRGFRTAPMTPLLIKGEAADMSWQKSLNDVAKRHHIRIWKQPGLWDGQEIWIAAATRDVDFAYMRPGRTFTHQIDANVDDERDKVAYDLAFTTCGEPLAWTARHGVLRTTRNATGDPITTDTRAVIVRMNACSSPRVTPDVSDTTALEARGGRFQRFVRREILVTRSDLIRSNPYYRTYEAARWTFDYARNRKKKVVETRAEATGSGFSLGPPASGFRQSLSSMMHSLQ